MHTSANSVDPDEMPHDVAFHQGLHWLLKQKGSSQKEIHLRNKLYPVAPLNIHGPS